MQNPTIEFQLVEKQQCLVEVQKQLQKHHPAFVDKVMKKIKKAYKNKVSVNKNQLNQYTSTIIQDQNMKIKRKIKFVMQQDKHIGRAKKLLFDRHQNPIQRTKNIQKAIKMIRKLLKYKQTLKSIKELHQQIKFMAAFLQIQKPQCPLIQPMDQQQEQQPLAEFEVKIEQV